MSASRVNQDSNRYFLHEPFNSHSLVRQQTRSAWTKIIGSSKSSLLSDVDPQSHSSFPPLFPVLFPTNKFDAFYIDGLTRTFHHNSSITL